VASRSTQSRVTWNAVTSGTPSWSTFAVMHISAMPPGALPSTIVAGCCPLAHASPTPKSADNTIDRITVPKTAPTKRCAPRRNSGWKREPSAAPIMSWPRFDTGVGSDDRLISAAVIGIATASAPKTNPLGTRSAWNTKPPASVAAIRIAKPEATKTVAPGV